jgi:DNA mismatch repair protein MutS
MAFQSILFKDPRNVEKQLRTPPDFFVDLGLNNVAKELVKGLDEFNIEPLFYTPLDQTDEIVYRQQVFVDIENPRLMGAIRVFSDRFRMVLAYINNDRLYELQRQGLFLKAVNVYCGSLRDLAKALESGGIRSEGLQAFRDYLGNYLNTSEFNDLRTDAENTLSKITSVELCLTIKGGSISVSKCDGAVDYSEEVERVFERFMGSGTIGDEGVSKPIYIRGHVEEVVLEFAAKLYPDAFRALRDFYVKHKDFLNQTIARFYREIQFYIAYLRYIEPLKKSGLMFCIPRLTSNKGEVNCRDGFDIALASKLVKKNSVVVTNSFHLTGKERIIIVTGPNHGGKTTFAREFAQAHYLAKLGVPVPGSEATLFLCDTIFTHFERGEAVESLRGKLEDELVRIRNILEKSTERSIIIINEMLGSTTVKDATIIGRRILKRIADKDCICVYVTFVDELALTEGVVSYVSQVDVNEPEKRTYKVIRQQPNGLAYALALAKKHRVSYQDILERVKP